MDEFERSIAVEGPERREAVKRLHRLAKIEGQIEDGVRELHDLVSDVYTRMNEEVSGRGNAGHTLSVSEIAVLDDPPRRAWGVSFRGRRILSFTCIPGHRPSPRPVIAKCEIREHRRDRIRTLLLTKENGGVHWEIERDPEPPTPLGTGAIFVEIISTFAAKDITQYEPS